MSTTLVSLSSGETFYVDGLPHEVQRVLDGGVFVRVGNRIVNAMQVAQLQATRGDVLDTPESLED